MAQTPVADIEIPVIDIEPADLQTAEALVDAAARYGFCFIKNRGRDISAKKIDHTFETSRSFFASPREDKAKCSIESGVVLNAFRNARSRAPESLSPPESSITGDFKEAFNFGEFYNGKAQQPVPDILQKHEAELSQFYDLCHELCMKILRLFALGLKISQDDGGERWFSSRHDRSKGPSGTILRLLYYPAISELIDYQPEVDIRAGAHSDYGSITLLFQRPGQPGLEILTPSSSWASVPVSPPSTASDPSPPILVNIGDLLSYWTNGLLKSTVHRVIFPKDARRGGEDRYSIAYFCHPVNNTELVPVPSEAVRSFAGDEGIANGTNVMTVEEHLNRRLAATYGWGKGN